MPTLDNSNQNQNAPPDHNFPVVRQDSLYDFLVKRQGTALQSCVDFPAFHPVRSDAIDAQGETFRRQKLHF
jgi:hypothetical protein